MRTTVCFPPAKIMKEFVQQNDPSYEILSFQFVQDYDSHRTIAQIYDRLEKLQSERTLVLVGYSLLTQLNIGLLHLLGNFFNKIIVEVHDNEGYRLKLETYRRNEKALNYLREILTASHNARKENMSIWSIIPMTVLYGKIYGHINDVDFIQFNSVFYTSISSLDFIHVFGNGHILMNIKQYSLLKIKMIFFSVYI